MIHLQDELLLKDFSTVVRIQMLAELEEIIAYKDHADEPARQEMQRQTWKKR